MPPSEADPFGMDDSEDNLDEATRRDVEEVERALRGESNGLEQETVELSLDEPESDEEPSRDEKKRVRGRLLQDLESERETNTQLRERVAKLEVVAEQAQRGMFQPPPQPGGQPDPIQQAIDKSYDEEDALREAASGVAQRYAREGRPIPDEVRREWNQKGRALETRRQSLIAAKTMRDSGVRPVDTNELVRAQAQAEHADVYKNERAALHARGLFDIATAKGEAPSKELLDRVMDETRAEFGLERRPGRRVTSATKSKLSGLGRGGIASPDRSAGKVRLDAKTQRLALEFYSHKKDWSPDRKMREYGRMLEEDIARERRRA